MTAGVAALSALAALAACSSPAPDGGLSTPEAEAPRAFDGVVGRDWVEIDTAGDVFDDVSRIDYGLGALWAMRNDTLLTSTDAVTWTEVPLDPRRPAGASEFPPLLYFDEERIVVAERDSGGAAPWIAIGDGSDWDFFSPDEIGSPVVTGDSPLSIRNVVDIAPVGDSLLFLVGVNWEDPGRGTVPCSCTAPLVLHPDGSSEWVAVENSLLGTPNNSFASHDLLLVDDGVLLITMGTRDDEAGVGIQTFFSANGIDWVDRTAPSIALSGTNILAPVVRKNSRWLTAATVRDGEVTEPDRVVLLASDNGIDWEPVFYGGDDEYDAPQGSIGATVASDDGFFVFLSHPRLRATDVLYSADTVEWTTFREAFQFETPIVVDSIVAVEGGLIALSRHLPLTTETPSRLWVSGATPYTPEQPEDEDSSGND
ncbi:MAG: hypothetical protein RJQ01_02940 [Microcella sp.]|uniref:hypothetical protein n=1 Tax=Microcella sp. TaxID=1913979 RepID=UPI003315A937